MTKILLTFPVLSACLLLGTLQSNSCQTKQAATNKSPMPINANPINEKPSDQQPVPGKLANGTWGGLHVHAEVKDEGAELEFDCATGTIDQPIGLDAQGAFDVKGKFIAEHAGPIRSDEDNSRMVRYVGRVKDKELTLTISDANSKEVIATYTLTQGNQGRIHKCY
jgi:hypothetical protein